MEVRLSWFTTRVLLGTVLSEQLPQECLHWFLTLPWCLAGKDAQKGPLLFDDLPPSSSADSGMGALFLPLVWFSVFPASASLSDEMCVNPVLCYAE